MSRLNRETNPIPGYTPGVLPQHKELNGSYVETGEENPLPTRVAGSKILHGKLKTVTTAGTRVQFENIPCSEITVIARKGNVGSIYLGGSDVSSIQFGVELEANEGFTFSVSNANLIYIDASVSGEGVSYVAI